MAFLRRAADGDRKTLRRVALFGGVILVAGFASGFAGAQVLGSGAGPESGKPRTLEQLAAVAGCKPQIITNKDLRQGSCATKQGKVALVTFTSDKGKAVWLKGAKDYGGKYLVGTRWVIASSAVPILETLRAELGGQIQSGRTHGGPAHKKGPATHKPGR
jgi:hypothetical protein